MRQLLVNEFYIQCKALFMEFTSKRVSIELRYHSLKINIGSVDNHFQFDKVSGPHSASSSIQKRFQEPACNNDNDNDDDNDDYYELACEVGVEWQVEN